MTTDDSKASFQALSGRVMVTSSNSEVRQNTIDEGSVSVESSMTPPNLILNNLPTSSSDRRLLLAVSCFSFLALPFLRLDTWRSGCHQRLWPPSDSSMRRTARAASGAAFRHKSMWHPHFIHRLVTLVFVDDALNSCRQPGRASSEGSLELEWPFLLRRHRRPSMSSPQRQIELHQRC